MKSVLVAYNPFIKVFGGGEKYFSAVLEVLQKHFSIKLINEYPEIDVIAKLTDMFHTDLSGVEVLPLTNQIDFRSKIPSDALFFQVSNNGPRVVDCRKHILHQQIAFPRLDQATARKYFPEHDEHFVNNYFDKRYSSQDHIFFPSNFIRDEMLAHWMIKKPNTSVVYPPVDELFFGENQSGQRCRENQAGQRQIISVGRFTPIKRQREQMELFQALSTDLHDDVRLTIIGSSRNQFMDQLKIYAQALPIDINYGLNQAALKNEYESSVIFWSTTGLSSDRPANKYTVESFGLAMAESMATGCVPIAIKGGGVSELIDSGYNGYVVSSMEEMGEVTKLLLANPDQLSIMSVRAREKAKAYSLEIFRKNILEIFLDG